MTGFSAAVEDDILLAFFGKTTSGLETNSSVYIGLSTADPTNDGSGMAEPSGGGYAREQLLPADWATPTGAGPATIANAAAVEFTTATADWSSGAALTHFGLFTAASGGSYLFGGTVNGGTGRAIENGDTAKFNAGALTVTLN